MVHSSFTISARFLDSHIEYGVGDAKNYTLAALCTDVYMMNCSSFPEPTDTFKAQVKLPWCGDYKTLKDDNDLQDVFNMFSLRGEETIRVDVELLPNVALPPIHSNSVLKPPMESFNSINNDEQSVQSDLIYLSTTEEEDLSVDDEDFCPSKDSVPHSIEMMIDDSATTISGSEHVAPRCEHDPPQPYETGSGNNSDDEQLSNAASYERDLDAMEYANSDDDPQNILFRRRDRAFRVENDGRIRLEVGQLFNHIHHFRQVLRDFVVQEGFELKRIKNEKDRFTAKCAYEGCTWRIHASTTEDHSTYQIKTMHERHCCQKVSKNQEANALWVASRFKRMIEENPDIKISFLRQQIHQTYGITIPNWTLYRARSKVLNSTNLEHADCYDKMYRYGYVVREKNPGSVALMKTIPLLQLLEPDQNVPSRFQRFFLSFDAQKQGFIYGCRPFIGLDGCHLKGKFPGVLITAIAIDGNYGVFPLALCICEGESSDSWGWFLHQLYLHIGLQDPRKITFMTDRQKGVLNAIEKWWPRSSNRFCVRHLVANLQGKFRGKLCADYVWKAAKSSNKADFLFAMSQLKDAYPAAYDYMMQIPFKHWSRHAFDEHVKSDHVTNNVTESFNSWADKFRGQPALTMFENIRRTLMKRMYKRLSEAEQWGTVLPPLVMKKIAESQDEGRFAQVMCASQNEYEVKDGETHYIVYLEAKTCTCGMWIVSGIPCKHAMAVITSTRKQAHDFVHEYLKKEKYIKAYSNVIHPIPDESLWPEINFTKVLPPECKKLPGRPKKNRKRGPDEPPKHKRSNGGKCSGCKQFGHNIRTCPMKKAAAFASKSSTIRGGKKSSGKTMGSSTFEVGSCSKAPKKRRTNEVVNMQLHEGQSQGINNEMQVSQPNTTAAPLSSSTNASQRTQGTIEQAFASQSQALQPVTINAPFYTSRNGTQSFQSRSNPGTVAGLDSDWSAF